MSLEFEGLERGFSSLEFHSGSVCCGALRKRFTAYKPTMVPLFLQSFVMYLSKSSACAPALHAVGKPESGQMTQVAASGKVEACICRNS